MPALGGCWLEQQTHSAQARTFASHCQRVHQQRHAEAWRYNAC
jgi:hypothetical protein